MPLVLRRSSGETAPVYAIHLDGDSSPDGHRYSLCPELFAATRLDIFCGQTVLPMGPDDRCSLVDGTHEMEALVIESFDLRDHALIRCHPIKVAEQSAAANRRPAGQLDGSGNLFATVAADRAFPAAVAELDR